MHSIFRNKFLLDFSRKAIAISNLKQCLGANVIHHDQIWTNSRFKKFFTLKSTIKSNQSDYDSKYYNFGKENSIIFGILLSMLYFLFGHKTAKCDKKDDPNCNQDANQQQDSFHTVDLREFEYLSTSSNSALSQQINLKEAIASSRQILRQKVFEAGVPGATIVVSIDGRVVWSEGIGVSDVENSVAMSPQTVLRIASISKSLTSVAVFQLVQEGKLDLDAPIQEYVPSFPKKFVDGQEVKITTRQLMNHTSGIRHYKLACQENSKKKGSIKTDDTHTTEEPKQKPLSKAKSLRDESEEEEKISETLRLKRLSLYNILVEKSLKRKRKKEETEFSLEEYYIKEQFDSVSDALRLFQDDDLLFKPGESYSYSTHAWTLVSAVVEGASGESFTKVLEKLIRDLGMKSTHLDRDEPIIYRRSRYYYRDELGRLRNSPYVNNSYKWAGGGILSTACDLVGFGNAMLYSYQHSQDKEPKGFLSASSLREMWTRTENTKCWDVDGSYGLGWGVVDPSEPPKAFANSRSFYASHTGGAIGASSVLLIMPQEQLSANNDKMTHHKSKVVAKPKGIVVAVIVNLQNVGLYQTAQKIAEQFQKVKWDPKVVGVVGKNKVYSVEAIH